MEDQEHEETELTNIWSIEEEKLLELLRRVEAGENPEMVLMEAFANSIYEVCDCGCTEKDEGDDLF